MRCENSTQHPKRFCRYHPNEWNSKDVYWDFWDLDCEIDSECEHAANAKMYVESNERKCCSEHCTTAKDCNELVVFVNSRTDNTS